MNYIEFVNRKINIFEKIYSFFPVNDWEKTKKLQEASKQLNEWNNILKTRFEEILNTEISWYEYDEIYKIFSSKVTKYFVLSTNRDNYENPHDYIKESFKKNINTIIQILKINDKISEELFNDIIEIMMKMCEVKS